MAGKKLIPNQISMLDFAIISGSIDNPVEHDYTLVNDHNYQVNFNMTYDLKEKMVKSDIKIEIKTKSKKGQVKEASGNFHIAYLFKVENLNELVDETGSIGFELGNAISSISYSTSRGIIMTRFQGTALSNFILPIIDPNELLK